MQRSPAKPLPDADPDPGLAAQVHRLLLYFDVFQHPLSEAELVRLTAPDRPEAVAAVVSALVARGAAERHGRLICCPGRADGVARRQARAREAERLWPLARLSGGLLARLPCVEGVLITGGLSKGSAAPGDDVDVMLLVAPGHVWTLKTAIHAARKTWAAPIRELLCTNYILATDKLEIDDQNIFTAVELATAIPLHGPGACTALLQANPWATRFVPGMSWSVDRARAALPLAQGRTAHAVASALAGPAGARVEQLSLSAWDRFWEARYAWLDPRRRAQRFKRRPEVATNHLHDFQAYVLGEVRRRLDGAGLPLDVELARGHAPVAPPAGAPS